MFTRAAVLYQIGKPLEVETLQIPALKEGQVLVKVFFSGLCRSQLNEVRGWKGKDNYLPHLLGHEGAGEVLEIGRGVKKVRAGQRVILSWMKGPGRDVPSAIYQTKRGRKINSGAIACWNQFAVISENRLTPFMKNLSAEKAALIGCAIATGAGIVKNTLQIKIGTRLAILGMGGIGLAVLLAAKKAGCREILAVDAVPAKLTFSKKLGATQTFQMQAVQQRRRFLARYQNYFDYSVEASGNAAMMEAAFEILRPGGAAVLAGNLKKGNKIQIDPFSLIEGKRILGTWGGENNPAKDFPCYSRWALGSDFPVSDLVTDHFSLDNINQGLTALEAGKICGRALIHNF